jgi:hypothetical protein
LDSANSWANSWANSKNISIRSGSLRWGNAVLYE